MFKSKVFCVEKFKSMLGAATFSMIVYVLILVSNTIIAGNLFDDSTISAINLLTPLISLFVGISSIISTGTVIVFAHKIGQTDVIGANKVFGQSLLFSAGLAAFTLLASNFCFDFYLHFFNVNETIRQIATDYFGYFKYVLMIYPIYFLMADMVYADGDVPLSYASFSILLLLNIILSIVLGNQMGISGISLSTLCSVTSATLVLLIHFLKKSNSLKPMIELSICDFKKVIKYSIVDASLYLFLGVQTFVLNKFVVVHFGDYNLPVLTLVISVIEFTAIFDGIGQSITPLVGIYLGETNSTGIKKTMRFATKTALVEGLVAGIILFAFASFIPSLFDIKSTELHDLSSSALRIIAPTLFCTSILFLYTSYYLVLKRVKHSLLICFFKDLLFPVTCSLFLGHFFGLNGLWAGLATAPLVTIIVSSVITKLRYRKREFPLLLKPEKKAIYSFDLRLTPQSIMDVQEKVTQILESNKTSMKSVNLAALFIEEMYMFILEKNPKKTLLSELTLMIDKEIKLIFRDDGIIFDITDEKTNDSSFRSYIVQNIMQHHKQKMNITTTSYNRNFIILPL